MKLFSRFSMVFAISLVGGAFDACANLSANPEVKVVGTLHQVMQGETQGRIRLEDIQATDLYALGPVAELDGEITVIHGRAVVARSTPSKEVEISKTWTAKAPMLVYSRVPN